MANEMIQRLTNQNDLPAVCSVQHANTIMMFKALFVALAVTAVHATPRDAVAGQQTILRGRIVQAQDPDLPVPQARITIDLPGGAQSSTHTDLNGRYEIRVPLQNAVTVSVTKSSYLRATFQHTSRSAAESLDVQLVKAAALTGRVLDSSGQPIVGAGVRAWRTTGPPGGNRAIGLPALTNDLGEFPIGGLMAGEYAPGLLTS